MQSLRAFVIIAVLTVVTPPLMLLQWLLVKSGAAFARRLPHLYHRGVARLMGLRITVVGEPVAGACLMASNHASWLDIVVLSAVAPVSFVSKREVGSWPIFGSFARLQRTVFVDRDRRTATGRFRDEMQARLAAGDTLVLFPEGTSSDGNRVLPFKSALMGAAERTVDGGGEHVPVQPVSVAYTGLHGLPMGRRRRPFFTWYGDMDLAPHLWEALGAGPVDVTVVLHEPVTVDSCGSRKALTVHCEAAVRHGLVQALAGRTEAEALRYGLDPAPVEVKRKAALSA